MMTKTSTQLNIVTTGVASGRVVIQHKQIMPRYKSYSNLDSPQATDGDMAFVRMISRLNPEQLQQGDLAYSQNGRMDNDRTWTPRKGVDVFSPALTLGAVPILGQATTILPFDLADGVVNGVYGACEVVDPVSSSRYILIATNTKAIAVDLSDTSITADVGYPGGSTISSDVEMVQALDSVLLFRDGSTAWEWTADVSAGDSFVAVPTTPTSVVVDASVTMTVDQAAYEAGTNDFSCIITGAGNRPDGTILTVYDGGGSGLVEGDKYEVTNISATSYGINAELADGTYTVTLGGKQPLGGGYIAMPDPAWGVYHENRLIVPYARDLGGGASTDDEIIFSDIFDKDTYDPILNQFRMGAGSADSLVGVSPLLKDRLLVLNRNSVHVIGGVSGSLNDATRTEVTREVGCVARKTIVEVGGTTMWLSDQGVYSATYGEELALIANSIPVSEPIENQIRQINWAHAENAVAAYVDNRYFLAVPYQSSTVNNAVFVYNFLNQGWESLDTYPEGFNIKEMLVIPNNGKNQLFLVNDAGAVHQTDKQGGADRYENSANETQTQSIDGQGIGRAFNFGTHDIKRFNRASVLAEGDVGTGTLQVYAVTTDPDAEKLIEDVTISARDDYTLKSRIGKRGYALQLKWETNSAKVRGYTVEGLIHSRSNQNRS